MVIERSFFEINALRTGHNSRNAYEKKLEYFTKTIVEAARSRIEDTDVVIEISVFQDTSVNLAIRGKLRRNVI